jgi:hypothetical protein
MSSPMASGQPPAASTDPATASPVLRAWLLPGRGLDPVGLVAGGDQHRDRDGRMGLPRQAHEPTAVTATPRPRASRAQAPGPRRTSRSPTHTGAVSPAPARFRRRRRPPTAGRPRHRWLSGSRLAPIPRWVVTGHLGVMSTDAAVPEAASTRCATARPLRRCPSAPPVAASGYRMIPAGRKCRWALAATTREHPGGTLGGSSETERTLADPGGDRSSVREPAPGGQRCPAAVHLPSRTDAFARRGARRAAGR